jgi:hypothetical protein
MKRFKKLKFKNEEEKAIAAKILDELVILAELHDSLLKNRDKSKKAWSEGCMFGIKYSIMHIAEKMKDQKRKHDYEKLVQWDKEEEKLLGKKSHKELQKLQK